MSNSLIPSPDPGYPMMGPVEEYSTASSPSGARRVAYFVKKLWWLPLLMLLLGLGAAGAYIYYWAPPHYVSSATMWETEKLRLPDGASFTDNQDYLGTQMELLRSGLQERVITRLQESATNAIPMDKDGKPVKVEITVKQAPKSTIFVIEAVSAIPAYAQSYLNALVDEYIEYKKNLRKTVSGDALASISEQVQRMERELKEEQAALTAFERTNNLAILQEEGTISGGYLAKLQTELSDLKLEAQLLDATSNQQAQLGPAAATNVSRDFAYIMGQSTSSEANAAQLAPFQEVELLRAERVKLSQNLRPEHPKIVKLDAQIDRDQKIIEMFRHQAQELSVVSRQNIKTKMVNVQASIKEWEGKIVEANNRIAEAEQLKFNVNRTQSLYDRLDMLLQNVTISRSIDQETLTKLEPASVAQRSYASETRLLLGSGIGSLLLGFGLVALIGIRDDRFTTLAEVNEKFGDVIVGQVPDMPMLRGKTQMPLLELEDDRDMYAESYRSLRSALLFMPREGEPPKVLLITSALPDEGKSTIAANLSRTLALGGARVLLVDGDLRKGYLHDLLGMRLEPGLADVMERPDALNDIIQASSLANFFFLARGRGVTNPGDFFLSPKLDQLLLRLRQKFDYVIIDSSPIFAADDAATIAPRVDGTLFVVRSRFSPAGAVKEALELLGQRQVRILGLVFNRAQSSVRSYYYYKNADYYRPKKTA